MAAIQGSATTCSAIRGIARITHAVRTTTATFAAIAASDTPAKAWIGNAFYTIAVTAWSAILVRIARPVTWCTITFIRISWIDRAYRSTDTALVKIGTDWIRTVTFLDTARLTVNTDIARRAYRWYATSYPVTSIARWAIRVTKATRIRNAIPVFVQDKTRAATAKTILTAFIQPAVYSANTFYAIAGVGVAYATLADHRHAAYRCTRIARRARVGIITIGAITLRVHEWFIWRANALTTITNLTVRARVHRVAFYACFIFAEPTIRAFRNAQIAYTRFACSAIAGTITWAYLYTLRLAGGASIRAVYNDVNAPVNTMIRYVDF